jgi:twitching motility two-component system response regulator PilH
MKTIFLIEDDAVIVRVYRTKLVNEGFRVEVAADGLAALKMLPTVNPDLVVLDLMMPKLSGADVLKFIRSTAALKDLPVIILSNAHMNDLVREAAAAGAERALLKSACTPTQLVNVINNLLQGVTSNPEPSARLSAPSSAPKPAN